MPGSGAPERAWFSFFDGAGARCPAAARSARHRGRMRRCSGGTDRWWLSLERGVSRPLRGLSEFGRRETRDAPIWKPGWPSTAAPCWEQDALTALLSYFPV
ncbi:MAG: hypothetical protein ACLRWQ_10465 [Flavonifractor plautii]